LQMTFRFSLVDKDGTLYTINSVYYNDENDFPTLIFFRLIEWIVLKITNRISFSYHIELKF
jgi:hypothetical protein